MLSEGRVGIDNTFSLCDGMSLSDGIRPFSFELVVSSFFVPSRAGLLRLSLDRETYERAGLVGRPDGSARTKRGKSRFGVSLIPGTRSVDPIAN